MNKTVVCLVVVCSTLLALIGCSKLGGGDVSSVKNGVLGIDKSITVGQALDGNKYFKSKSWNAVKDEQGRRYVDFTGEFIRTAPNDPNSANLVLRFVINADNTFQYVGYRFNYVTNGDSKNAGMGWENNKVLEIVYANNRNLCEDYESFISATTKHNADSEGDERKEQAKIRKLATTIKDQQGNTTYEDENGDRVTEDPNGNVIKKVKAQ